MQSQGLERQARRRANLKGDDARAAFIKRFKEVQRLQTQLDQYTDLTPEQKQRSRQILPKDELRLPRRLPRNRPAAAAQQDKPGGDSQTTRRKVDQLDFEFVLFASATIDYDYIMKLIARFSAGRPAKQKMSREQLIGLIAVRRQVHRRARRRSPNTSAA
jgi:type I restriction enzyme, R subunit